jgi:4-hydroxy-4-methyl-2-oxoglutarate aldolase
MLPGSTAETGVSYIGRARALGAATLVESGHRNQALPSSISAIAPHLALAGPAFPVQVPPGDNLWLHHAVYAADPGDVIVASAAGGLEYGYFGEVMAEAATARGIAGLVIEGGVRDTAQVAALGFPVFSERVCIRGTTKDNTLAGALGQAVVIGGVTIRRGDLVVGDADGIVIVPAEDVAATVANGIAREEKERELIERLRNGACALEIYHLPGVPNGVSR